MLSLEAEFFIVNKYINNTKSEEIKNYLLNYKKGARCTFPDYKCPSPCGFKEGVTLEREI